MIKSNPFKFGSIVDEPYFTDRTDEIKQVSAVLNSSNHLILISPRRYGKSSLVYKVLRSLHRPVIAIDLQLITSVDDFAAQLLKRIYREYPSERIRQFILHFRIIPSITLNPATNEIDVSFHPSPTSFPKLEDVLNLLEKLGNAKKRCIVVMDEFQEIHRLDSNLASQLRSVLQHHQKINYVFLGSQESMIREIFEKKKSPFYHFGFLMTLHKIPEKDFMEYLSNGLKAVSDKAELISGEILDFTRCHPYYTQQLAFMVWESLHSGLQDIAPIKQAVNEIIRIHDMDYERLWGTLNRTDRKLMIGLAENGHTPLSEAFYRKYDIGASSTVFSSLTRMMKSGYIIKTGNKYEIDDPFFSFWISLRRNV